ncbi:MAG: UvrD-helicase domain-containing protein [Planctomycetota bacterium]|nr:UvrD-helicase domain-containing protein [Planctomycetota bacterium]
MTPGIPGTPGTPGNISTPDTTMTPDAPTSPVMTNPLLDSLTDAQKKAVEHLDGPLLVLAGPGSGKTTVVTRRIANLIDSGIPPWQILALTFTNKAAGEMRERINTLVPENVPGRRGLTVATFHSFCVRLLRNYASQANIHERFSIYDGADQREAIKQSMKEAGLSSSNWTPASVGAAISNAKNQLLTAEAFAQEASDFYARSIAKAYVGYERRLKDNNALDFDDLLMLTARLLKNNNDVRDELQQRYQYLLIDEYQDTNHAQFVIAHSLAASHSNICVVGDPDQSIYGWRGADIRNILEFETLYPDAVVIPLGQNFRSTAHIVEIASKLIENNTKRKKKTLHTELGEGEKAQVIICQDEHHEAKVIVDDFKRLHDDNDVPWKEMAVLYRVNSLSRVLEEAFRSASVPYVIARGTAFYDRKEIKDALAYLRYAANPSDEVSMRGIINTPTRGIGKTTLDRIENHAIFNPSRMIDVLQNPEQVEGVSARAVGSIQKFNTMVNGWRVMNEHEGMLLEAQSGLAELIERMIRESGLEAMFKKSRTEEDFERLENLGELVSAAADFVPPDASDLGMVDTEGNALELPEPTVLDLLSMFLEQVALVSDADMIDPANGAVTLMTLHAAKGLEFDGIAMAGLEQGLLPHQRAAHQESELEEERRLCFVGITRARKHLMLTRAAVRTHRGMRERTIESQFLGELPGDSIIYSDHAGVDDGYVYGGGGGGSYKDEFGPSSGDTGSWSPKSGSRSGGDSEFPVGCRVMHPKFGLGKIEAITRRPAGSSAQVTFSSVGTKTLILEYAKLQRVD